MNTLELLHKAGITQGELARLLRISRVSINLWVSGRRTPGPFHEPRFTQILQRIQNALEAGTLPLDTRRKRGEATDERIAQIAAQLKAAGGGAAPKASGFGE